MENKIPSFLLNSPASIPSGKEKGKVKMPFIEGGIHHLAQVIKKEYLQWEYSSQNGLFQKIDPRIKILFLIFFIVIVSLKRDLLSEVCIAGLVFILVFFSRIRLLTFYSRVLFLGFFLGFLAAFPSAFNVITEGEIIGPVLKLSRSSKIWIYPIPAEIGMTKEGLYGVIRLTLRMINSLSLSFLVIYTTPLPEIVRALKVLKVPDTFIMIINLSMKYIFIFSKTAEELHLAKKSRTVREGTSTEAKDWIVGRIAYIFRKTRLRYEEVFKAMIGRGFSNKINLYGFQKMRPMDWVAGIILMFTGILFLTI